MMPKKEGAIARPLVVADEPFLVGAGGIVELEVPAVDVVVELVDDRLGSQQRRIYAAVREPDDILGVIFEMSH